VSLTVANECLSWKLLQGGGAPRMYDQWGFLAEVWRDFMRFFNGKTAHIPFILAACLQIRH
jgi:hypothetical protein